jgi:hypothetical protein
VKRKLKGACRWPHIPIESLSARCHIALPLPASFDYCRPTPDDSGAAIALRGGQWLGHFFVKKGALGAEKSKTHPYNSRANPSASKASLTAD